jgi:hypothetical protein
MSLKKINTVLAAAFILFILWFGTDFILIIKGIRDVVLALVLGILLVTGHRRALGLVLLVESLAAYGDMATVLAHHGSVTTALGVHGLTATLMAVNGLLIMHETRRVPSAPAAPAPQPA